jgi:predicted peroxiredoxin
MWMIATER